MRHTIRHLSLLAWLPLLATGACRRQAVETLPAGVPVMTEGNIIAVILAANNTDLSYARLVPSRAVSQDVKSFAIRMTTDHTLLNARANEIAQKNGIVAEDNVISLDFRDVSAARRDVMRELEGAKFDSTYAVNEVKYHTELLAALDGALLPNARTPELREFITQLKPAVSAHLAHAEQIRAAVATKK